MQQQQQAEDAPGRRHRHPAGARAPGKVLSTGTGRGLVASRDVFVKKDIQRSFYQLEESSLCRPRFSLHLTWGYQKCICSLPLLVYPPRFEQRPLDWLEDFTFLPSVPSSPPLDRAFSSPSQLHLQTWQRERERKGKGEGEGAGKGEGEGTLARGKAKLNFCVLCFIGIRPKPAPRSGGCAAGLGIEEPANAFGNSPSLTSVC